jgi:hypothetical protein
VASSVSNDHGSSPSETHERVVIITVPTKDAER